MSNSRPDMKTIARMAALILAWCSAIPAMADPIVLRDLGPTRPVTDYGIPSLAAPRQPVSLPAMDLDAAAIAPSYPVKSPGLAVGDVTPTAVNLPQLADRPIFIIGSDATSRRWLAQHQSRLAQINAIGILAQAEGPEDFNAMKALAGSLPLAAINAQETARLLGLAHYPVLVSAQRIEQ